MKIAYFENRSGNENVCAVTGIELKARRVYKRKLGVRIQVMTKGKLGFGVAL